MYLKEGLIRFLKVKNVLLLIAGIFFSSMSVSNMVELSVYYFGDWDTVLHARSTPESVFYFFLGVLMIAISRLSRRLINDAGAYSAYFESSISGKMLYSEPAQALCRSAARVKPELHLIRPLYMKRFRFWRGNEGEGVELYSKTALCECHNCGAPIEKRVYFTGVCPYCGGSDLFAKVIAGDRFYSISSEQKKGVNNPAYYEGKSLRAKRIWLIVGLAVASFWLVILLMILADTIANYNNHDYLVRELLSGRSYSSIELIQKSMMNNIIFDAFVASAIGCAVPLLLTRIRTASRAQRYAAFFSKTGEPYVSMQTLGFLEKGNAQRALKGVTKALRERYLRNCSPEQFEGTLKIALARQIVRDSCPYCGAPVTGAVSEHYRCHYCQREIMGVVRAV